MLILGTQSIRVTSTKKVSLGFSQTKDMKHFFLYIGLLIGGRIGHNSYTCLCFPVTCFFEEALPSNKRLCAFLEFSASWHHRAARPKFPQTKSKVCAN